MICHAENASITCKDDVADLSAEQIAGMSDDNLVLAIRTVADRFGAERKLENMDRKTLETMTFLARRCCQNEGFGSTTSA